MGKTTFAETYSCLWSFNHFVKFVKKSYYSIKLNYYAFNATRNLTLLAKNVSVHTCTFNTEFTTLIYCVNLYFTFSVILMIYKVLKQYITLTFYKN